MACSGSAGDVFPVRSSLEDSVAWYLTQSLQIVLATFALGLTVGWLWWGRAWRRVPFGESDAVRAVSDRYQTVVAERDTEIKRLGRSPQGSAPSPSTPGGLPAAAAETAGAPATDTGSATAAVAAVGTDTDTASTGDTDTARTVDADHAPTGPAGTAEAASEGVTRPAGTAEATSDGVTMVAAPEDVAADEEPEAGTPDDLQQIEGVGPRIAAALDRAGLRTFRAVAEADEEQLSAALREAGLSFAPSLVTWNRQAQLLAAGDEEGLAELKAEITGGRSRAADPAETAEPGTASDAEPEGETDSPATDSPATDSPATDSPATGSPATDSPATDDATSPEANGAGTPARTTEPSTRTIETEDDEDELERVEGIGPRIATALRKAGIHTYRQLAAADAPTLQAALAASGLRFTPSLPTWSRQAALLAEGDEAGFLALIRTLVPDRESGRPS
jgi:predicted flap endonuclease-1-like 5' DNA nuclease